MHDALRDTWAYNEMAREGWEEGWKQGWLKGWEEGWKQGFQQAQQAVLQKELQAQRLILLEIVHHRFPALEALAKEKVESIDTTEVLRRLMLVVSTAQSEEQVRQVLL